MRQYPEEALTLLRLLAARPQGGTEPSLVLGERAFDLPALTVDAVVKTPFHLAPVARGRPFSTATASIEGKHGRSDSEMIPAKGVERLGVVGGIA